VRTLASRGSEGCRSGICGVDGGIALAHILESSSSDSHILVLCIDGQSHSRAARGRRHRARSCISGLGLVGRVDNFRTSSSSIKMPMQSKSGRRGALLMAELGTKVGQPATIRCLGLRAGEKPTQIDRRKSERHLARLLRAYRVCGVHVSPTTPGAIARPCSLVVACSNRMPRVSLSATRKLTMTLPATLVV